jgi:hypothetical protein
MNPPLNPFPSSNPFKPRVADPSPLYGCSIKAVAALFLNRKATVIPVLTACLAGLGIGSLEGAEELALVNPGFEAPLLGEGEYTSTMPGWTEGYYETDNPGIWVDVGTEGDAGVWNPDDSDGFTGSSPFEGDNSAWALSYSGFQVGLAQVLESSLEADTWYVLEVQVGNAFINDQDLTAPFRLELLAGGELIAFTGGSSPESDRWQTERLVYYSGLEPQQKGLPLEIRLLADPFDEGDGFQVDFDAVSLKAHKVHPFGNDLAIENAGFEQAVLESGDFSFETPGWTGGFYEPAGSGSWRAEPGNSSSGTWNPDGGNGYPDGDTHERRNNAWAISGADYDSGLSQILEAPLEAGMRYVLEVHIGNPYFNGSETTADYRIELLAGGVLQASQTGPSPAAGLWERQCLIYHSGADPAQLGEPLEIRLVATAYADTTGTDGYEVDFDAVSLTATPLEDLAIHVTELSHTENSLTLTWSASESRVYGITYSQDLSDFQPVTEQSLITQADDERPGDGAYWTVSFPHPVSNAIPEGPTPTIFLRVVDQTDCP